MRSTASLSSWIHAAALPVLAVALAAGCGQSATSGFADFGGSNASGDPTGGDGNRGAFAESDSGAAAADVYRGSPLCHASSTTCMPDDDGSRKTYGVLACATPTETDAGADAQATAKADVKGCRVSTTSGQPRCLEAIADHGDGTTCTDGSECAPGFDCVAGENGRVCRRYCCSGTCETNRAQSGGETFCDVQKLANGGLKVPVCMPTKACNLFVQGECAANETCAVVSEDGDTGCVEIGLALAGESCDEEHCAAGMTCLGQPGSRRCYDLCRTKGTPSCHAGEICQTSTVFMDPTVGICMPSP